MKGNNEIQVCLATLMEMAQEYFDKRTSAGSAEFEVKSVDLNKSNVTGPVVTFKVSERKESGGRD